MDLALPTSPSLRSPLRLHYDIDRKIRSPAFSKYAVLLNAKRVESNNRHAAGRRRVSSHIRTLSSLYMLSLFATDAWTCLFIPAFKGHIKVMLVIHHVDLSWPGWSDIIARPGLIKSLKTAACFQANSSTLPSITIPSAIFGIFIGLLFRRHRNLAAGRRHVTGCGCRVEEGFAELPFPKPLCWEYTQKDKV